MFYIVKHAVTPFKKYNRINTSVISDVYCLCSSEQSTKAKSQKELFKTLKELKYHLPPDKRSKGRASTLHTLRYAMRCIKQVKGQITTNTIIYPYFVYFCILLLCKLGMFFFLLFQPMKSTIRCLWSMTVSPQVWMCPHILLKKSTVLPQNIP